MIVSHKQFERFKEGIRFISKEQRDLETERVMQMARERKLKVLNRTGLCFCRALITPDKEVIPFTVFDHADSK